MVAPWPESVLVVFHPAADGRSPQLGGELVPGRIVTMAVEKAGPFLHGYYLLWRIIHYKSKTQFSQYCDSFVSIL